jgi:hypothetical protein
MTSDHSLETNGAVGTEGRQMISSSDHLYSMEWKIVYWHFTRINRTIRYFIPEL